MGACRPSGHGGGTYIRCGDELRAVLTPSAGRNYPLIFPRQGRRYILNPNAQSQDKRARTNPIPPIVASPIEQGSMCRFTYPGPLYSTVALAGANNSTDNKFRKNAISFRLVILSRDGEQSTSAWSVLSRYDVIIFFKLFLAASFSLYAFSEHFSNIALSIFCIT